MGSVLLVDAAKAPRALSRLPPSGRWALLGTDPALRTRLEADAPDGTLLCTGERLHQWSEELRKPYLDFLADLGTAQPRARDWWASTLANRSPYLDDTFLLLCLQAVGRELLRGPPADPFVLVAADPWLLDALKAAVADEPTTRTDHAWPAKARARARSWILGTLRRIRLAARVLLEWAVAHAVRAPGPPEAATRRVAILSYAWPQTLSVGEYRDPYLGELPELLKERGVTPVRWFFPFQSLRRLRGLARLQEPAWPMGRSLRPWDAFRAFATWRPRFPLQARVAGLDVRPLLARARVRERNDVDFQKALLYHRACQRAFRQHPVESVVFFFENQRWDKMLVMATRQAGTPRAIGVQHSTVPRFELGYFLGRGEDRIQPLPDVVLTNGPYAHELLESEGGYPPGRLVPAGGWRYRHLLDPPPAPPASTPPTLLVALPFEADAASRLTETVLEAARRPERGDWRIRVKPHPHTPLTPPLRAAAAQARVDVVEEPFDAALAAATLVVSHSTTTLEAWLRGKDVLRLRFDDRLELDPTAGRDRPPIETVDEHELTTRLVQRFAAKATPRRAPRDATSYFSTVSPERWVEATLGRP